MFPERLPGEIIRHPNIDPIVPAAFNVELQKILAGNLSTVGAFGVNISEGRASVQGIHLNVDGIDMNGNGFVTASGYEVGPGILGLSPSVNTIRATTVDSTATLDAMGINVHPGGRITLGYDVRQFFIVTENGQRVFPPIRIIS
ncbi:hypothetical protein [Legionella jamestowniensis]|uniref:Uncharacterized protein n=1 Tax=Legionella jamestowniensis TaxID=455 RepID=A0A0W0UYV3_9GAMM|nr:hypothetical protein [Legionella jamestowniensis]KTD13044.1 hypothetical protein Ljam_0302 [Legionella jamestowniensis]SFL79927.1 hypothetical protein SAMN02746073_2020 [Legionella jamestowniensis DSM 19215]